MDKQRVPFDPESESVVVTIANSVASIRDTEPNELPPLARYFDTELLERLTDPSTISTIESGHITFPYDGVTVTVDFDGELKLEWE